MMNKMMKKAMITLAAAAMMVTSLTGSVSAAPCSKQAIVTASTLNVRTDPNTDAAVAGVLNQGEGVIIVDTNDYNGWTKIGFNGGEKYVKSCYISEYKQGQTSTGATDDHGFKADSNIATKNVYTVSVAPGTFLALRNDTTSSDASIIGELHNGDTVEIISGNGKFWCVASTETGRMGYVNSNYLK